MSKQLTLLVTYPGLVLNVGPNNSSNRVRVVTGRDEYKILEYGGLSPITVHSISDNNRFATMSAGRNCTRAEAMMLGMNVDKRAKVGDFVIMFEPSNPALKDFTWYDGVYAVTEIWQAGPYARLVGGSSNGRSSPGSVILLSPTDYMVINWKGS